MKWNDNVDSARVGLFDNMYREVSGNGYSRMPFSNGISFPQASDNWGNIAYAGIFVDDYLVAMTKLIRDAYVADGDTIALNFDGIEIFNPKEFQKCIYCNSYFEHDKYHHNTCSCCGGPIDGCTTKTY